MRANVKFPCLTATAQPIFCRYLIGIRVLSFTPKSSWISLFLQLSQCRAIDEAATKKPKVIKTDRWLRSATWRN